jgi:hypothetical protein
LDGHRPDHLFSLWPQAQPSCRCPGIAAPVVTLHHEISTGR